MKTMILVILTALTAVCGAAKLDQSYLPPITAKTAGGSAGALQAPFEGSNQGLGVLPIGSYSNDVQGVVVDAVNPGTRTSGVEPTGLGGPRNSYGSIDSKVGDAAFRGSATGFENSGGASTRIAPGFGSFVESDGSQADNSRGSNLKFTSDVGLDNYSYGYETENGIAVGENGVAANGVQAEGGYSYKGDDGKTYSVSYTAGEGGYKPQGHHLPTPPPIPDEILKSLEKNAKEEAAGHVDDGSYDAQKYNDEGDYSNGAGNNNARVTKGGGDATASGSFASQGSQPYRPSSGNLIGSYNSASGSSHSSQEHGAQGFGHGSGNKQSSFGLIKEHRESQGFGVSGGSSSIGGQFGQASSSTSQADSNFGSSSQYGANQQVSSQGAQIPPQGTAFFSQTTENRFGVQAIKPEGNDVSGSSGLHSQAHYQGSEAGSRTPSFGSGSSNVNSAYSSAVASGSGSASAFASTGPSGNGLKNEFITPLNLGSSSEHTHGSKFGSDSSAGASFSTPSTASASASVTGTPTFGSHSHQYSGTQKQVGSQQHSGLVQGPTPIPQFSSTGTPSFGTANLNKGSTSDQSNFGSYSQNGYVSGASNVPSSASASASVTGNQASSNSFPSRFGESQLSGNSATNSEYIPPVNIIESTGKPTYNLQPQGFDSSSAASTALHSSGSANPSGSFQQTDFQLLSSNSKTGQYEQTNNGIHSSSSQNQFGSTNTHFSGVQPTQPTLGFQSISNQGPTKVPDTDLSTPFESNGSAEPASVFNYQTSNQASNSFGSSNIPVPTPTSASSFSSTQQTSQSGLAFQSQSNFPSQLPSGQYKPQPSLSSFTQTGPTDATFASSTQQPAINQQQGYDASYHYKQPSKPFTIPSTSSNSQFSTNHQSNLPVSTSQQGSSSSYNGITQAAISSFPTGSPSTSIQSSQFVSKPTTSTQFGIPLTSQQTSTQFGATGTQQTFSQKPVTQFGQKPIVQSQTQFGQSSTSQTFGSSQPTQQYQGTIYQYNKPAETLPAPEHKGTSSSFGQVTSTQIDSQVKPTQIVTDSRFGSQQGSSQFNSQSLGSTSAFQQTQTAQGSKFGSQSNSQFGQKPQTSQGTVSQGQSVQTSQFGQKPFVGSQTSVSNYQQSQFSQKPQTIQGSSFSTNTNTQSQQPQFGKKPISSTQSGSYYQQTTPGVGLSLNSVTPSPTTFGQKPFGSSQTIGSQQTQFGSTGSQFGSTGSQFSQKPQSTIQGSSFTSNTGSKGQSVQTSQFGISSSQNTGFSSQNTQSGSGNTFQYGTKPLSSQGLALSSGTASQTQFGQTSQSGQKVSGTGVASNFQQTQFGSSSGSQFSQKPQKAQGTISQVQPVTASGNDKPFGSSQSLQGSALQQTQFGSTASQFGQTSQSSQTNVPTLTTISQTIQPSQFGQKPFSSTQTQFGSSIGQFSQKPQVQTNAFATSSGSNNAVQFGNTQTDQVSKYPQTSQFGTQSQGTASFGSTTQKPLGNSLSQTNYQQSQTSGKYGSQSQFEQTSQSNVGNGQVIGQTSFGAQSQKPFGSQSTQTTNQQSQFNQGQKPFGTSQNSGSVVQTTQFGTSGSSFGQKKPSSSFSSSTGQFGQKPQAQASAFASNSGSNAAQFGSTQTGQVSKYQQTSQFAGQNQGSFVSTTQKPLGSSLSQTNYQQSQYSQNSGKYGSQSQFGQTSQSNVGSGQVPGQNSFGAQSQKPLGSQSTQSTYQQSQFNQGEKPFGTSQNSGSVVQTTQFGTSGSSFGQKKPSSSFGSSTGQFGQKPQAQASAFASNSGSNAAQFGSSQTGQVSKYQQTSQFAGQNQGSFGSTTQKPLGSSLLQTNYQQSQYSQNSGKYGSQSQFGQTSQSNVGSGQLTGQTSLGAQSQKPLGSQSTQSTYQQSQFNQGDKPFGTSQNSGSVVQTTQFGTSGSSFGQKKPSSSFGSSTGQFGQKPQAQANAFASNSGSNAAQFGSTQTGQVSKYQQTSQFAGQSQGSFGSTTQKPIDSSLSQTNNYQQSQYSQTSGKYGSQSQFGQTSQSNVGSGQVTGQTSFGVQSQKPLGSQSTQSTYQQTQLNKGQKPFGTSQNLGSVVQTTQFGTSGSSFGQKKPSSAFGSQTNKPFGSTPTQFVSTTGQFGQKPQAQASAFASNSGSNAAQFGNTQTSQVSKYQQTSQFAGQSQGSFGSTTVKPLGSSLSQANYQQSQISQTAGKFGSQSQFGQTSQSNVGSGQVAGQTLFSAQSQKPFGSQSSFQQTQINQGQKPFGNSQGSNFQIGQSVDDQKTQPTLGSFQTSNVASQSTQSSFGSAQSANGYNYNKPNEQSSLNPQVSTSQAQFSGQPIKPFGSSSTQGTFQQTQSSVGSTQFGAQPSTATDFSVPLSETARPQFSGQSFKPASSTQGSSFQSQSSAVSTSQFGLQPTQPTEISYSSGQPFTASTQSPSFGSQTLVGSTPQFGVQPTQSIVYTTQKPSQTQFSGESFQQGGFSSTQAPSFPNRLSSNVGVTPVVSTFQSSIVPVPGYEIETPSQGSFLGQNEEFGGPRDPPRFDDKTGYHY